MVMNKRSSDTLVEQIVQLLRAQIQSRTLRPGSKAPSIRQFASQHGVSTFTVVEAYDRLAAQGYLQARRGSGFFVCELAQPGPEQRPRLTEKAVDSYWLLRDVFENSDRGIHAGCGWLPDSWHDGEALQKALRHAARQPDDLLRYGHPKGHAALRERVVRLLAEQDIQADPGQILLTLGASQALDLVARRLTQPGDTVLVDDPGYSNLLSALRLRGLQLVGVPMTPTGPDVDALGSLLQQHQPKLYFTHTQLHNPTGASYNAATAYRVLQLAQQHGFMLVEDNVSHGLLGSAAPTLAGMDQLQRVIHIGSFSKTIAPGLRVGFVAADAALIDELVYHKMVSGMATPQLNEQLVWHILTEGHHRKHLEQLRDRLARAQQRTARRLDIAGFTLFFEPGAGMFLWAQAPAGLDPLTLSQQAAAQDILLAPGYLFRPDQSHSSWLRFNVAYCDNDRLFAFLDSMQRHDFVAT